MNTSTQIPVERDAEGYLIDPEAWDDEIARELAAQEKLELTDACWAILHFMREYWREHQVTPDVRHVVGFITSDQGVDKKVAKDQLFQLFPYGYVQQACKVAGMIKPRAWSTG
jgi:tRNA 2-thiouridine synthesizing protein E